MGNIWIGLNLTTGDKMQTPSITNRNQIFTFLVIGLLGNLFGWIIYKISYDSLDLEDFRPTISWIIAFHFGVLIQHFSHRRVTFADPSHPYLSSLYKSYISYLAIFVFCLFANIYFNEVLDIYHHLSWLLTILVSIPLSFLSLKKYAFRNPID